MGKTKEFKVIECECGNLCPIEYSYPNKDGSWTCGQCMVSELSHQIHACGGKNEQETTEALHKHGVSGSAFWGDDKVIDFVNWYIKLHKLDFRYILENGTIIESFKNGDDASKWHCR